MICGVILVELGAMWNKIYALIGDLVIVPARVTDDSILL
jgi:hypothetical protein